MKRTILILSFLLPTIGLASDNIKLDRALINETDQASLQRGAKTFVNYCLGCHSAASMRYNRLQDIGLTASQIKENLIFSDGKVGDPMIASMNKKEAKAWFGVAPPDLSVISRARGADWLYTYMRSFYRDDTRPTGWNNLVFDKVSMPHVLGELQGQLRLKTVDTKDADGHKISLKQLVLEKPGKLSLPEYDNLIADLVNYLVFMGEPSRTTRKSMGWLVLLYLGLMLIPAYYLKKEFWKDVH